MKMRTWTALSSFVLVFSLAGCDKGPPVPAHDHAEHVHADHDDHAEHDHAAHDHAAHDHAAHDHAAHDHAAHDHAGHALKEGAAPKKSDEPAGPKIETGSFSLAVAPAQPQYAVGKPGDVEIALESRGEWHVNEEYPIRVDLKAGSGVELPKAELVRDDAKEFGAEKVRFVAAVQPSSAGSHEVTCDVSFAMCTEENCILEKRTVAMVLEVQ